MAFGDDFTEEVIRYAFLLGSSLRNEDTEQFCQIYDKVLPKTLSPDQVDGIKDTARAIADLEEDEYNELVVHARDFSLARSSLALALINNNTVRSVSASSSVTAASSSVSDLKYMDMEEEVSPTPSRSTKPSLESLSRTSRHLSTFPCDTDGLEDGDSGVFNSSKLTAGSVSSDSELVDPSEVHVGHFDYFDDSISSVSHSVYDDLNRNSSHSSKLRQKEQERLHDKAYDGSYIADSDIDIQTQSKDGNVDSPVRQEFEMETFKHSSGYLEGEMTPFQKKIHNEYIRKKNNDTYDEVHANDSDNSCEDLQSVVVHSSHNDDLISCNAHKTLYRSQASTGHYARVDDDDDDSEFPISKSSHKGSGHEQQLFFHSSPDYGATRSYGTSSSKNVDSGVNFPLHGSTRSTSSNQVKIDKTVKSRDRCGPPFGDPLDQSKVFGAAERLIDGRGYRSDIPNLPKASPVTHSVMLERSGSSLEDPDKKDKKKKKKKSKEDADAEQDENGNPVAERDVMPSKSAPGWTSTFPRNLHYISKEPDEAISPAIEAQQGKKPRRRKRKDDATFKPESLPGYFGDKPLNELLQIIDGSNGSGSTNNNNKRLTTTSSRHESDKVLQTSNRHEHDKAAHCTNNRHEPEKTEHGNSSAEQQKQDANTLRVCNELSAGQVDGQVDLVSESSIKADVKGKRAKKKNKASSKASSEVDDRSSRSSEVDVAEKMQDTFTDTSDTIFTLDGKDVSFSTSAISSETTSCSVEEDAALRPNLEAFTPYIFTDFDTKCQKEEQFTTVTKRKKKSGLSMKDFESDTKKGEVTFRRPSRPFQRSYTPPPIASSTNQDKPARTLSPSAFPVLSNSRDARRNSTGNVSEVGCCYDSDIDSSVKSVPVTGPTCDSTRLGRDISIATSHRPPISYASITAGGKSSHNSSGSTSSQDGDHHGNNFAAPHPAGDPSEGPSMEHGVLVSSSDNSKMDNFDDLVLEPGGGNIRSRPVSASSTTPSIVTELSRDVPPSVFSPASVSISSTNGSPHADCTAKANDSLVASSTNVNAKSTAIFSQSGSDQNKHIDVHNRTDFPALLQSNPGLPSPVSVGKGETVLPRTVSSAVSPPDNDAPAADVTSSVTLLSAHSSKPDMVSNSTKATKPPQNPTQNPRNSIHKSKNKQFRSVVFLDRRMNEGPKNLDISFGFEPQLDNNVLSGARLDSSSTCSSDSGRGTDNDSFLHADKVDNNNLENGSVGLDNRTSADVIILDHPGKASHVSNNVNSSQLIFMGPEHAESRQAVSSAGENLQPLAPINGMILAQSIYKIAPHADMTTEKNRINAKDHAQPVTADGDERLAGPADETSAEAQSTELFTYARETDPNFQTGQFNHEAAVTFLYSDWQKVQGTATLYGVEGMPAC